MTKELCKYCESDLKESLTANDAKWSGRTDSIEVFVQPGALSVTADIDNDSFSCKLRINYCPMCGKRVAN